MALVDEWGWEGPKTKDAVAALASLEISGSVLVVLAADETIAGRSFANLPHVTTTSFGQLSAHDVLRNDWIVFSDRTLPGSDAFAGTAAPEAPEAAVPDAAAPEAEVDAPEAEVDAPEGATAVVADDVDDVADAEETDADA